MTVAQRSNSFLIVAILIISLMIHGMFILFFSLGRSAAGANVGADEFFVVNSLTIENAVYGEDPIMHVDREIRQPFPGTWFARIATSTGEWVCGNSGSSPYKPDARLPDVVRLFDFWLFIDANTPNQFCRKGFYPLPPGCYIVDTTWEIQDERVQPPRLVDVRSNEFCVTEE